MVRKPTHRELQKKTKELIEKVPQNQSLLETLIDNIPTPVFYKDKHGVYQGCNDAFASQILGLGKDKIIGRSLFDLSDAIPYDLAQIFHQKDNELFINPGAQFYEAQVQCADGVRRDFLFNKTTYTDSQGDIAGMVGVMTDITERKRAENALKDSEEKFRLLYEKAPLSYQSLDINGRFLTVNQTWLDTLGYTENEVIGKSFADFLHPAWQNHFKENFPRFKAVGEVLGIEFEMVKKDGTFILVSFNGKIGKDGNGEFKQTHCILHDITEQRRSEENLRKSEKRYRSLFEQSNDAVFIHDLNGRVLDCNQTAFEMLGYEKKQILHMNISQLHRQEDLNTSNQAFEETRRKGHCRFESRLKRADGTFLNVEISARVIEPAAGIVQGIVRDISERKRTDEALRDSENRFRLLATISPAGIYMTDARGDTVYVNESWCQMAGLTPQEAAGKGWVKAIHPEDREQTAARWYKMVASGGKWGTEYRFLAPDGKITWVYGIATEMRDENGSIIGYMGTNININERKQMEAERARLQAQLQQAQKMEAIGTLAGGIAHDFNNILAPIIGCTELSLEDAENDTFLYENLQAVLKAGMRARDLVQQILTFSRQSDKELKPLKLQTIVKEVVKLSKSTLPSTIQIQHHISNQCGLVMADATQIHQITMNLITNAYHAMEETGGNLSVTLKDVELTIEDLKNPDMMPGPYVRLMVSDTGIGMERSVMERIFEPYFTTKQKEKGTGLGLSVVHGIVKEFGGDIQVYSEPDKGTTFHVYLPIIKSEGELLETSAAEAIPGGTEHILLVDDEDQIIRMEKQILERLGYQVTARTNSLEALEIFRQDPDQFDLIITDMTMPNMTGTQLAQKLFQIRPHIPIVICSGFSEKINEQKAREVGICGYVMKPVVKKDLAKKIREALE